jgi:hypothetical protein
LVTGNPDGTLHLYRLGPPDQKELPGLPNPDPAAELLWKKTFDRSGIDYVALSRDGKLAFNSAGDGQVGVWDVVSGKERHRLPHPARVIRLAVTPDDRFLLTACVDNVVRIWDVAKGNLVRQLEGKHDPWCLSLSADGRYVQTRADGKEEISVVSEVATGKELRRFTLGGQNVFTQDGKRFFSARATQLSLVDANDGRDIHVLHGNAGLTRDVAVSRNSRLGATVSGYVGSVKPGDPAGDFSVRIFDLKSGQELRRWQENAYTRWSTAFLPDSRHVAAASMDGTVRVYDIVTGREAVRIDAGGPVEGVAVSGDGRLVLAGGVTEDYVAGLLTLWRLPRLASEPAGHGK